ncbi:unnamed protein product [Linum trigynum]|uniref:Uncharacterized protein n=1 Tax=Linum trigynum TaxID=586398 RepID=A0AAV2FZL7_9ROSI
MDDGTLAAMAAAGEEPTPSATGVILLTVSFGASAGILVWLAVSDAKHDGARDQSMFYIELFVVSMLCGYCVFFACQFCRKLVRRRRRWGFPGAGKMKVAPVVSSPAAGLDRLDAPAAV